MTIIVGVAFTDSALLATDSRLGEIQHGRGDVIRSSVDGARKLIRLRDGFASVSGAQTFLEEMQEYEGRPVEDLRGAWREAMTAEATKDLLNTWRSAGHDLVPTLVAVHHKDGELGLTHLEDAEHDPNLEGNSRIVAPPDMDDAALNDLAGKLFQGLSDPAVDRKIEALRDFFEDAYRETSFAGGPVQVGIVKRTGEGFEMEERRETLGVLPV